MKDIIFLADTLNVIRVLPNAAKLNIGLQLDRVQRGLQPTDFKHMPTIAAGVKEIRLHSPANYRVFYRVKESVIVIYVFNKKAQKTPVAVIKNVRLRLNSYLTSNKREPA